MTECRIKPTPLERLRKRSRCLCNSNGWQRLCGSLLVQSDAALDSANRSIESHLHLPLRTLQRWTAASWFRYVRGGRPIRLPFARGLRMPALTSGYPRARHSTQDGEDHFPVGVLVSSCSENEMKSMPRLRKFSNALSRCDLWRIPEQFVAPAVVPVVPATTFDASGTATGHLPSFPTFSWKGAYQYGSVYSLFVPTPTLATTFSAFLNGNLSGNGTALVHHSFGIFWCGIGYALQGYVPGSPCLQDNGNDVR